MSFSSPSDSHGADISFYKVEWWDTNPATSALEIEKISILGGSSGSFRLSFNGSSTGFLSLTSTADTVRTALQALPDIRSVQVSLSIGHQVSVWSVTFLNDYPSVYNAAIGIDTSGITALSGSTVTSSVAVTPSSALPHGYGSDVVAAASEILSYTYVIEGLFIHQNSLFFFPSTI